MHYNAPDHFSYNYKINLSTLPAKKSDRIAPTLLLPGLLSGLFLIIIGCYELIAGLRPVKEVHITPLFASWFNLTVFDIILIILGIGIMLSLLFTYCRYKKIFIDTKNVTIIYRHISGNKTVIKEPLKNYLGVRFRVEFFQFGFMNKNKYIIELYHKDFDKTAPLYISTSGHDIRKIWADYARQLNLPQLIMTDEGLQKRETKDIGKSLSQMYQENLLVDTFNAKEPIPASISWVRKKDKSIIKSNKIRWDIYNILIGFAIAFSLLFIMLNIPSILKSFPIVICCLFLIAFITSITLKFCTKDKLVIKPSKLVIVHKTFMVSRKKYEVAKDDIEAIDIAFNPVFDRYFLAIIGAEKTFVFGKKLPLKDLQWIKKFLINDIVKK